MKECIYGVDTSKKVTPIMVRDAIIDCFKQAHDEILQTMKEYYEFKSEKEFEELKHLNVKFLVESKFEEVGGDFENPSKRDLIKVIDKLAEYASHFRRPEIIKKHYDEIMKLIRLLKD